MKVKDLIKELKEMPQDLEIFYANHDNAEYESSGYVNSVWHIEKSEFSIDDIPSEDKEEFKDMPDEWIIIRG